MASASLASATTRPLRCTSTWALARASSCRCVASAAWKTVIAASFAERSLDSSERASSRATWVVRAWALEQEEASRASTPGRGVAGFDELLGCDPDPGGAQCCEGDAGEQMLAPGGGDWERQPGTGAHTAPLSMGRASGTGLLFWALA